MRMANIAGHLIMPTNIIDIVKWTIERKINQDGKEFEEKLPAIKVACVSNYDLILEVLSTDPVALDNAIEEFANEVNSALVESIQVMNRG